jgi:hypothetical protein
MFPDDKLFIGVHIYISVIIFLDVPICFLQVNKTLTKTIMKLTLEIELETWF